MQFLCQKCRADGIAAQLKEVIIYTDPVNAQDFFIGFAEDFLLRRSRGGVGFRFGVCIGLRQGKAVHFPVPVQRERFQVHEECRNHVMRQFCLQF